MRPYKPAPKHKNASANRIRERYLHQLGLQRGIVGAPAFAAAPESNHVVVISGLPSLPEDRATTEHVMESHDFSISKHSQHTGTTPGESSDANSSGGDGHDEEMSDAGGSSARDRDRGSQALGPEEVRSHCSKSTLSASPGAREGPGGGGPLTHMALAYPTSLLSVPSPAKPLPPPSRGDNARTFPPSSRSAPWGSHALSKPASVLLDSAAEYRSGNDHDSVSSAGTSTTAESSFNAAMVSRDWGTGVPSSQAGSPASNPGVHFQLSGHPRVRAVCVGHPGPPPCAASSLSHALHRFNLDSDCEASSVASNSVADDAALVHDVLRDYDDEASWDDAASHHSHASAGSARSQRSSASHHGPRKKIGKTQRLMDRAAAHDRILRVRSDRSREMRANVVHHQRMSHRVSISGISSMMTAPSSSEAPPQLSESPCSASTCASQASVTLMHVNHGSGGSGGHPSLSQGSPGPLCGADLGRTPTASNCSDLRRALRDFGSQGGPYSRALRDFGSNGGPHDAAAAPALPAGVHLSQRERGAGAPLVFHPRLASRIPTPPPAMVLQGALQPSNGEEDNAMIGQPLPMETETVEAGDAVATLEHTDYNDATATVDDVLEVAVTLSKLGGGKAGPVPRIR